MLDFLAGLSRKYPVSIMSQYNPCFYAGDLPEMHRALSKDEYEVVLEKALDLFQPPFSRQETDSAATYVPDFMADTPFGDCRRIL